MHMDSFQSVFRMKVSKGEREKNFYLPWQPQGFLEARLGLTNRWWLGRKLRVRQPLVNANFTPTAAKRISTCGTKHGLVWIRHAALRPPVFCLSTDLAFQGVILFRVFIMQRPDQERARLRCSQLYTDETDSQ